MSHARPLDHLGVQLDVMGHILGQISTWSAESHGLDQVTELANVFSARHLLWPTELLEAATHRAATDFYRASIQLTGKFLGSEMWE